MSDQTDAPLKVTINGQEYDPDEAQALIDTGRKTQDYEKQYNTSLDKVWPEYNRSQQTLKQLETELAESKAQLTEYSVKQKEGSETTEDVQKAREAAKKLGIVLDDDIRNSGYIKKEDLPSLFQTYQQEQDAVKSVLKQADTLESEINGSDGRPKFNKKAVLAYASAYNYSDLNKAYEDMNSEVLEPWKAAQIAAQKAKSLKTLGPNGEKLPNTPTVNKDNFRATLNEALYGAQD